MTFFKNRYSSNCALFMQRKIPLCILKISKKISHCFLYIYFTELLELLLEWVERYGNFFSVWIGNVPYVLVANPPDVEVPIY